MFIITRTTRERFWVVIPAPPSRSGWEFPNPVSAETCVVEKLGFRLQRRQKLAHPLQPAVEFPYRRRVGNANVIFCAEAFPRHRRYMRLAQKLSGYIRGRVHVLAAEERRHVRVRVKRAFRQRALEAWYGAQACHHVIAQLDVLLAH